MTDTIDRAIEIEVARILAAQHNPTAYGIWVHGKGFIRNEKDHFGSTNILVAKTAQQLYGAGIIVPVDDELYEFEKVFLERESQQKLTRAWRGLSQFIEKFNWK